MHPHCEERAQKHTMNTNQSSSCSNTAEAVSMLLPISFTPSQPAYFLGPPSGVPISDAAPLSFTPTIRSSLPSSC